MRRATKEPAMTIHRRSFNRALLTFLVMPALTAWPAHATDYPTRPVSIITPAPAGVGPDVIARIVADKLSHLWRQQVLVLNRPGAGGLIGLQAAAAIVPDGYTFYLPLSSTFIALPERHPKLPLDLHRDIVPIGFIGEQPMIIAVNPKLGVKTIPELVALAKKRRGEILYGANQGSLPNLVGEMLQRRTGAKLTFVPYANMRKAMQDAVAGTLQVYIESAAGLAGQIKGGALTALAVASTKRLPDYPDLPTVAEALPDIGAFEARGWFALMARAGTPGAIVRKVGEDLRAVLAQPDLQAKFAKLGTYVHPMSSSQLAAFIDSEQTLWRPVAHAVNRAAQ
jgi:tripartite-type tricarboxylate transporter receptor subunit TctC